MKNLFITLNELQTLHLWNKIRNQQFIHPNINLITYNNMTKYYKKVNEKIVNSLYSRN